jgi:hypothetical protein
MGSEDGGIDPAVELFREAALRSVDEMKEELTVSLGSG